MNRQLERVNKWQCAFRDIEQNHNMSIYEEVRNRCSKYPAEIALSYQGNEITYGEMIRHADAFSNSLAQMGVEKGTEIPVCMTLCPEFVYLLLGASKLGAVLNIFGDWFAVDYVGQILQRSNFKFLFLTDDHCGSLQDIISRTSISNLIVLSLNDSLPQKNGVPYNPYFEQQRPFLASAAMDGTIPHDDLRGFLARGETTAASAASVTLDDPYTITYTSGTTDPTRPKAVTHAVRSYMFLSRFKDRDISHMGNMEHLRVLAHFPSYIHAGLTTAIFDPLFEKATIILSPIYSEKYFPLQITELQPNFACGGVGAWYGLCRYIESRKIDLPFLMLAVVTGEGMSQGEERYFNRIAKRHHFGVKKLPYPLAPVSFSIGGGTSESSGVFITLFKSLQRKKPEYWFNRKEVGLTPLNFVLSDVVGEDNRSCSIGEVGIISLSSPCNMLGYTYDEKLNDSIRYFDEDGREWMKMGAAGYKTDNYPHIMIIGRPNSYFSLPDGGKIWFYQIEKKLYKEISTLMSCEIIVTEKGEVVFHTEQSPDNAKDHDTFAKEFKQAIRQILPLPLQKEIYLRIHSTENPFPIAASGKRDHCALDTEGISQATLLL